MTTYARSLAKVSHDQYCQQGMENRIRTSKRRSFMGKASAASKVALVLIVAITNAPSLPPEIMSFCLKAIGVVIILALAVLLPRTRVVPIEVRLYLLFVAWGLSMALVVAKDSDLALRHGWTLLQVAVLFLGSVTSHRFRPGLLTVMWGLWIIGIVFGAISILDPTILSELQEGGGRISIFGGNPNSVGAALVMATLASLYLTSRRESFLLRLVHLLSIPLFSWILIYTGSRKMAISAALIAAIWLITEHMSGSKRNRKWGRKILVTVAIVVAGIVVQGNWSGSILESRWAALQGKDPWGNRDRLATDGFALFLRSPVTGIGLYNQTLDENLGFVAHNEFVDVLATTGVVGAILYFSLYWVIARRVWRIEIPEECETLRVDVRLFWTCLILFGWLMIGFARYSDPTNFVLLGAFIGHFMGVASYRYGPHNQRTRATNAVEWSPTP